MGDAMANRHKYSRRVRAQANHPFYSGEHSHEAEEVRDNDHHDAAVAHHVLHVGLVVGRASAGRADRPPRVQAHRGRSHEDAAVPRLEAHDISGNRPWSEALSCRSHGNIASRKGGREEWSQYAHQGSHTRYKQNAAISGRGARGRHCTGYPANA